MPQPHPGYHDHHRRVFFIQDTRKEWIELNETSLRRWLHKQGFSAGPKNGAIPAVDALVVEYQTGFNVEYAWPLAGYAAGLVAIGGNPILVTASPWFIEPKVGEFPHCGRGLKEET